MLISWRVVHCLSCCVHIFMIPLFNVSEKKQVIRRSAEGLAGHLFELLRTQRWVGCVFSWLGRGGCVLLGGSSQWM